MMWKSSLMNCIQASIDQLLSAESMDLIVDSFVNSDFCDTVGGDERCPDILDAVLRNGLPLLAAASDPESFKQVQISSMYTYITHISYTYCIPGLQHGQTWNLRHKKDDSLLSFSLDFWIDTLIALFLQTYFYILIGLQSVNVYIYCL